MSQLRVEAQGATAAGPEAVWMLIADANAYPRWGPWTEGGYRPPAEGPSRPGAVQWFRYGRRSITVEEVLEADAPRRLVYTVRRGLPVRNYQAEVTLTPASAGGTSIRWTATWDKTFTGRIVHRKLQQVYREVITSLVAAADHDHAASSRQ
jgi:uncharacterized protein YndB with AHSA1/START domain